LADIFVSYCHDDRARSEALCELLKREGYSVSIDRDFLVAGDRFRDRIEEEILRAKAVIVLWSTRAVDSEFVRDEASRATRRTVLLQLIIDDMPDSAVPLGFGELQRLRCQWSDDGQLGRESRDALLAALARHLPVVEPLDKAIDQLRQEVDDRLGSECDLLERLGTGRLSVVFKARHQIYGLVALKVTPLAGILLLPGLYAEFLSSIESARELSHPNISSIRDVRLLETVACTVTDYVEGESLAHCIASARPWLPLGRIKDIASDIVRALAHAHVKRIVHSRLSPSNVLIERRQDRALVSDFGMPRFGSGPEASAARALLLDARYMSPEQCLGQPTTPQSDQYSLGAILYEMLTGRAPFVATSTFGIMRGHCEEKPTPIRSLRPQCPREVESTVLQMLGKKPRERYMTTAELAHEIGAWPLCESVTFGPTSVTDAARAAKAALESYNRCLTEPDFLARFYKRLQEHDELATKLESMNFDSQIVLIEKAIRHLLEYGQGQEDARRRLDLIATSHRPYALDESHLRTFIASLIDVAVESDRDVEPGERETLRNQWLVATQAGFRRFAEVAGVAAISRPSEHAPRFSGVVPSREHPLELSTLPARARS
jgi:serine/threonine protein kinase